MSNTIIVANMLQKETIAILDEKTRFLGLANRDYTGQLRKQGDTVEVQSYPSFDLDHGGTAGNDITAEDWAISSETFQITKVVQKNLKITDLEQIQSNLSLRSGLSTRLAVAQANTYDREISVTAAANVYDGNDINAGSPVDYAVGTVIAGIESMRQKLEEQNAFDASVLAVNPAIASLVRQSPLYTGYDKGLGHLQGKAIGNLAGFEIMQSNLLPYVKLLTYTDVAVATKTISFSDGTDTVTFTANAAPSTAGQYDVAGTAAAQLDITINMINGTGTPGATSYIELSTADRALMKKWGVTAVAKSKYSTTTTDIISNRVLTFATDETNASFGTAGKICIAMDNNAVNFVVQEDGFKITDANQGFRESILLEKAYDSTVFSENSKRIATLQVQDGSGV